MQKLHHRRGAGPVGRNERRPRRPRVGRLRPGRAEGLGAGGQRGFALARGAERDLGRGLARRPAAVRTHPRPLSTVGVRGRQLLLGGVRALPARRHAERDAARWRCSSGRSQRYANASSVKNGDSKSLLTRLQGTLARGGDADAAAEISTRAAAAMARMGADMAGQPAPRRRARPAVDDRAPNPFRRAARARTTTTGSRR